jgi:hypothetical protein
VTHDELLAKIKGFSCCSGAHEIALRAVVELHKPSLIPDWVPTKEELICWCAHIYPCPTIKVIEEQISG